MSQHCAHGAQCFWLSPLQQFINVDYVPKCICEIIYNIHNSFAKKKKSRFTEGGLLNEVIALHQEHTKNDKKKCNQIHTVKLKVIEAFRVLHGDELTEQNKNNMKDTLKYCLEDIQRLISTIAESSKKERIRFNSIVENIKNDEPIEFIDRKKLPIRRERERELGWHEDIEQPAKNIIQTQKKYKLNRDNIGKKFQCGHQFCKWSDLWIIVQEMCGDEIISTSVPMNFCEELRRVSVNLNTIECQNNSDANVAVSS